MKLASILLLCLLSTFLSSPLAAEEEEKEEESPVLRLGLTAGLEYDLPEPLEAAPIAPEEAGETEERRRGEFVAAPIPTSNPTIGSGLGLVAAYVFPLNSKDSVSPNSLVGAGGFYTDTESWGAGLLHRAYFSQDRWRAKASGAVFELNYDFYGIGWEAGDRGRSVPTSQKGWVGSLELLRKIRGHFFAGLRFRNYQATTTFVLSNLGDELGIELPDLALDSRIAYLGAHLEYDSRDGSFSPGRGTLSDLLVDFSRPSWGSDFTYESYELAYNRYLGLGEGKVLALRGYGCYVGEDTPFYSLCLFGSGSDLRGYQGGRYRDHALFALQAEYRWQFYRRFGMVLFAGTGGVGSEFGEIDFDLLLPSGGAGLRWMAAPENGINIRVDYAWGQDGSAWYVGVGEAF